MPPDGGKNKKVGCTNEKAMERLRVGHYGYAAAGWPYRDSCGSPGIKSKPLWTTPALKITLDGKEITPTDANGAAVEPFAISGTTYLPVRAVAERFWLGSRMGSGHINGYA